MKLFNKISTKTSAFILLFSFLGIYMINISCSIGNVVGELDLFSQTEHNHDNHSHSDGHQHSNGDEKSNDKEDDGCCGDDATAFFLSVASAPTTHIELNFSPTQLAVLSFEWNDFLTLNPSVDYFSESRPPPDILPRFPDTRIFIQSFQI
tara:strand:+ start:910 stop:1359 length:450 start_codon:yes stop_codon:yes gene_type:complete